MLHSIPIVGWLCCPVKGHPLPFPLLPSTQPPYVSVSPPIPPDPPPPLPPPASVLPCRSRLFFSLTPNPKYPPPPPPCPFFLSPPPLLPVYISSRFQLLPPPRPTPSAPHPLLLFPLPTFVLSFRLPLPSAPPHPDPPSTPSPRPSPLLPAPPPPLVLILLKYFEHGRKKTNSAPPMGRDIPPRGRNKVMAPPRDKGDASRRPPLLTQPRCALITTPPRQTHELNWCLMAGRRVQAN